MAKLIYLDAAKDDLINIARYIARESGNKDLAIRYTARIRDHCRKLAAPETSQRGRDRSELVDGMRSEVFGNHVIFFMYEEGVLKIINILEGHRDIEGYFHKQP